MRTTRSLVATPESVGRARNTVMAALIEYGSTESTVEVARLLVSELASNAVRHSGCESYELVIDLDADLLRVDVADGNTARVPTVGPPDDLGGRGLRLVETLASRWGIDRAPGDGAKHVWFELPCS